MRQVAKWDMIELTFTSAKRVENPFVEVCLFAVFRQGEAELRADGFYDGEENGKGVWRVRFAPPSEGHWAYNTHSDAGEMDGLKGEFECAPAASRGGLTTDPHFPNWFARQDGSFQFMMSEGWYPHPCNGFDREYERRDFQQPSEADMAFYFGTLADHRVNLVIDIGQLYARQSTVTDPTYRWPWKVLDAENNKFDKDRFNLDYYQRLDRLMRHAQGLDLFFAMELLYDNSVVRPREWSHHPLNTDNGGWLKGNAHGTGWDVMFDLDNAQHVEYTARYLRYTVARYSAYRNMLWSIGSENGNLMVLEHDILPHALFPEEKAAEWYDYWGDYIARHDPHGRLRSFGDCGRMPTLRGSAHNGFNITQDPRDRYYTLGDLVACYKAMNCFGEDFWHYGRPAVIGEMTAGTVGQYDAERHLYWIALASGYAMGRADRHFGPAQDGRLTESEIFGFEGTPVIYEDMRRQAEFVEKRGMCFWRMRPSDRLLRSVAEDDMIYCLAAEGEEYLVYFVQGGTAGLVLPRAEGEWYNPRTGETAQNFDILPGANSFTAPDDEDWVLYIRAAWGV